MNDDKQTLLRSGVDEIGVSLKDFSVSAQEIFNTISKEIESLEGNEIFLGDAFTALMERFSKFKKEFPRFVKEIENYSTFMTNTLSAYQEVDQAIEKEVGARLNKEINDLNASGKIGSSEESVPIYETDSKGNVSLNQLHPDLNEKMNQLLKKCEAAGLDIRVTADLRSVADQDQLYAQGRTKEGAIVTNRKGADYASLHQWGTAFDVALKGNDPYNKEKLTKVGEIGKSLGLEWGGDWETFQDMPHFQLPGFCGDSEKLKDSYGNPGNFADTWFDETI